MAEILVRELKHNATIFDTISSAENKEKKTDTEDENKLRKVYNILNQVFFHLNFIPINRSILDIMKNSSIRNYKEKILQDKSDEVTASDLKEFFSKYQEDETEIEYYEEDTLDEFVKEFDVQKLMSSAFEDESRSFDYETFECINRYLVMNEDEDEISGFTNV